MSGLLESTVSRKDVLSDAPRRAMDVGESPGDGAPGGPGGRRSSSFRRYTVAPCRFSSAGCQGTD